MLHLPLLRAGIPYHSLRQNTLRHVTTGDEVALLSQANQGMISRDRRDGPSHQKRLAELAVTDLVSICQEAAKLFSQASLPLYPGADQHQLADDYVAQLSSTTGLPHTLCRANMEKIHRVLSQIDEIVDGLTRCMDPAIIDAGWDPYFDRL